jgi:26S proteasome regulatory subunit N5
MIGSTFISFPYPLFCSLCLQEEEGNIASAADILQEVHVETYGSLSKKEKVEYILEQLRLTIRKHDFVRAAIVAGKINRKHLQEMSDYKIRFFHLMSTIHRHERNALELVKDYHAIFLTHVQLMTTKSNDGDPDDNAMIMDEGESSSDTAWKEALQAVVVFLALAPYSNEQQDLLHRVAVDAHLEKLPPQFPSTIQLLLKKEIIHYPLPHQEEMEQLPVVTEDDLGAHWHDVWIRRVIHHNIRVASCYYTRIHGTRLAELLQLSPEVLETEIASMVSDGAVQAKIHRPRDIISFGPPPSSSLLIQNWSQQIEELLHLVDTTTHWIHKEQMTTSASSSQ